MSSMLSNIKCVQVKSIGIYNFVQVVSSPPGSSGVSSEISSSDNKENATTGAMNKHHPDDLQNLKTGRPKIASSGKVLQPHN